MNSDALNRRQVLQAGSTALFALLWQASSPSFVFAAEGEGEELVPFLDMPRTGPNRLDWETLDAWITPQEQVFSVQHYGIPEVDAEKYALQITGLVEKPQSFTLAELKQLPQEDQLMTLECSGNGASKGFMNAIYNSRWTGARLAPLLKQCGIKPEAKEVVFIGHDRKEETLRKGTRSELSIDVPFGRSLSVADALQPEPLLAWDRNGEPLVDRNGGPLRLIVPGWYGIANVKWLKRIELRDTRYMGRYMARDYVTVRGERRGDEIVHVETSVGKMNLKSIIARVTRGKSEEGLIPTKAYGAVWSDGTGIKAVEVQVDGGPWQPAQLDKEPSEKYCWRFFSFDAGKLKPGKHSLVSRAIDADGRIQPRAEDDEIALKKTYWEAYQQWPRAIDLEG